MMPQNVAGDHGLAQHRLAHHLAQRLAPHLAHRRRVGLGRWPHLRRSAKDRIALSSLKKIQT